MNSITQLALSYLHINLDFNGIDYGIDVEGDREALCTALIKEIEELFIAEKTKLIPPEEIGKFMTSIIKFPTRE